MIFPYLSIVSPVYQSEKTINELINRLLTHLPTITQEFEIILVDDGSYDNSWQKIEEHCRKDVRIKGIQLSRNFGQHSAITAGIKSASGEWIVVMDCDLQDLPEEIINLYKRTREGYDIVLAKREKRQDSVLKQLFSKFFYFGLSFLTGSKIDSSIANFGIYHRKVIDAILQMSESIRFFPSMVNWVGFKKTTLCVQHGLRFQGKSSYNFKKKLKLALDITLAYSNKPLRMIVGLGFSISLIAFLLSLVIFYQAFLGKITILGYASLIISISFFSGVIISVLGIVGLYIGKIFEGTKNRPIYLIKKTCFTEAKRKELAYVKTDDQNEHHSL